MSRAGEDPASESPSAPVEGPATREDPDAASPSPVLEPPRLVVFVEAPFPPEARAQGRAGEVTLRLTIDAAGAVTEAEIVGAAGHGFDEAARAAALQFRFDPARRGEQAIPSTIHYTYWFEPPAEADPPGPPEPEPESEPEPEPPSREPVIEVEVEGPSVARRRQRSSDAVHVVELDDARREAADLGEVLARDSAITVRRAGGLGSTARLSLGGLGSGRVRTFLDGVPLDLSGFQQGTTNIPVNLIDRVEIYRGVVPIRYGADALGGAIDLVTRKPVGGTGLGASYTGGSFGTHRLTAVAHHLFDRSGVLVRGSGFFDQADNDYHVDVEVADAKGRPQQVSVSRFHDAYRAGGGSVELGVLGRSFADRLLLRGFATAARDEIQHRNTSMTLPFGQSVAGQRSGGAQLRYEKAFARHVRVDVVAGYAYLQNTFRDLATCAYDWYGRCVRTFATPMGETPGGTSDRKLERHTGYARVNFGWSISPSHEVQLSLAPTGVRRTGRNRTTEPGAFDPLAGRRALFDLVTGLAHVYRLWPSRLENTFFLKDYVQIARADEPLVDRTTRFLRRNSHQFGIGDGLRLSLARWAALKASYEWATRLPQPDELFGDGVLVEENLRLRPETSHNLNVGVFLTSGRSVVGTGGVRVEGYARFARNLISLLGVEPQRYQNVLGARIAGLEAGAHWVSPGEWVELRADVNWHDARNDSRTGDFAPFRGDRIPNQPWLFANGSARLRYRDFVAPRDDFSIRWHTRYTHSFFVAWESPGGTDKEEVPPQLLHALALSYGIERRSRSLAAALEIDNITDAKAFDFYGIQRPGRAFYAKLTLEI